MVAWPMPRDEDLRCAVLPHYGLLGSPPEPAYDAITAAVAELFRVPICLITVVGERTQWLKSRHGLDVESTSRAASFCAHTIAADEPLIVPDAERDVRFRSNPLVLGHPHIRFYAGAPIITADGAHLGALCAIDTEPRSNFDAEILSSMATVVSAMFDARLRWRGAGEPLRGSRSTASTAHKLSQFLNQRRTFFDASLFGDPAFQLLLELFVADTDGREITLADCCAAIDLPPTTGQRWVKRLVDLGLLVQHADSTNRRRVNLQLTDAARTNMAAWLGIADPFG